MRTEGGRLGLRPIAQAYSLAYCRTSRETTFRPSHTVKNGKRYRYYFCHASNKKAKGLRLPAHDVEKQVSLRLQSFLRSPNEVMKSYASRGSSRDHAKAHPGCWCPHEQSIYDSAIGGLLLNPLSLSRNMNRYSCSVHAPLTIFRGWVICFLL